jgi:beta-glucosidase
MKKSFARLSSIRRWFMRMVFLLATASVACAAAPEDAGTYRDPALPVDQRVQDLLTRMDRTEKIGQLNQKLYGWDCYHREGDRIDLTPALEDEVKHWHGLGALYGLLRADPWSAVTWSSGIPPERRVEMINRVQQMVLDHSRWKIPVLFSTEASHGYFTLGGAILPTAIGIGSSWNPALYEEAARAVVGEIRRSGEHMVMISCLDVARDPRWGRTEECFSEDPVLVAAMARAATIGTQGESPAELLRPDRAVVILKHLAGQGASAGGHNAAAAVIGPREFREIHLPAALAGARAGALSCMAAYNEVDGIPCCGNRGLLTDILRQEWGFQGVVMADGTAIDIIKERVTGDFAQAGAMALHAGVDLGLWDDAYRHLGEAIDRGMVSEDDLNTAVARVLRLKFEIGLFDHPLVENDPAALAAAEAKTREVNLRLARESLVLLKNDGGLLPFKKGLRRIAVIGPNADSVYRQTGDYTPPQRDGETTTVLAGIRALVGTGTEVVHAEGCAVRGQDRSGIAPAVALAKSADVVVLVLGGSSDRYQGTKYASTGAAAVDQDSRQMDSGEGVDVADLDLGGVQQDLADAIRATGVPLAVVLIQGRPHSIAKLAAECPAILCAWYPGQRGGQAVAEVLFGDVNPSGRLSISVPRSSAQLPVYYDFKAKGDAAYYDMKGSALFPFGYGLSYTTFKLAHLRMASDRVSAASINAGGSIPVSVDVENTGSVAGAETIQLYLHGVESTITRRVRELKLFTKVVLQPGEKRTVAFQLGRDELAIWGPDMKFAVGRGLNEILVQGGNTEPLKAGLRVD